MGFFSNLKNAVTGGAAEVRLHAEAGQRGQAVPVVVEATAKADAQVNAVYVMVRAVEYAEVRDSDYADGHVRNEIVRGQRISYETKIQLAGATALRSGQTYRWEGQLEIPDNVNPSLEGQMIRHVWQIQAGLDMKGNDPDSGWQTYEVC